MGMLWVYSTAHLILMGLLLTRAHYCDRPCSGDTERMICQYDMKIEYYYTMSKACFGCPFNVSDCFRPHCVTGDGVKRPIVTVDRMLPGPQIRVCENDIVVVNVTNHLRAGDSTAFHWHGMYQKGTPFMDGVPMLTQCPIPEMTTFQYRFKASPAGTHFWHSHAGFQRGDGAAGALIVKAYGDVHESLYDYDLPEHTIIVQDWTHNLTLEKFFGHLHAGVNNKAHSIIINGKGTFHAHVGKGDIPVPTPHTVFFVESGHRYRFRIIANTVLNCPIEISVDDHRMLMIASDGSPFEPVTADVFVISGGERYDFVLTGNETPGTHWMYARGLADCSQYQAQQVAILHYVGSKVAMPTEPPRPWTQPRTGVVMNPFNEGIISQSSNAIPVSHLKSLAASEEWVSKKAKKTFYLSMDMYSIDNYHYNDAVLYSFNSTSEFGTSVQMPQVNRVSFAMQGSPALTQYNDIRPEAVCEYSATSTSVKYCAEKFCECMHILKVDIGDIVEIVWIDEGLPHNISSHSFHLHGQHFRIMSTWQSPDRFTTREAVIAMDANRKTRPIMSSKPIQKDTVMIPDGGYVIGKFKATSPGLWLMHCHNEHHMAAGMAVAVQVGLPKDWPRAPNGFPKCGSWRMQ